MRVDINVELEGFKIEIGVESDMEVEWNVRVEGDIPG